MNIPLLLKEIANLLHFIDVAQKQTAFSALTIKHELFSYTEDSSNSEEKSLNIGAQNSKLQIQTQPALHTPSPASKKFSSAINFAALLNQNQSQNVDRDSRKKSMINLSEKTQDNHKPSTNLPSLTQGKSNSLFNKFFDVFFAEIIVFQFIKKQKRPKFSKALIQIILLDSINKHMRQ